MIYPTLWIENSTSKLIKLIDGWDNEEIISMGFAEPNAVDEVFFTLLTAFLDQYGRGYDNGYDDAIDDMLDEDENGDIDLL